MKALVTGAAGFVGRHLCPKLEAAGYFVAKIDPRRNLGPAATLEEFIGIVPSATYDLVVHLAANIVNVDERMKGGMAGYSDIELDLAMCRWLEKNPPAQCAVLMSSCAVDYPDDPYCIVKRNLELFAKTLHKKGVPVIVLRPFSGYGEDQSEEYPFRAILDRALRHEDPLIVWGGAQVRDWLHVDDLTDAILFAINKCPRRPDAIEVGTKAGVSLAELAKMMASACGYSPEILRDNAKASSSLRRVAGESSALGLQSWGWTPKVRLQDAILSAVASRQKVETPCPA